MGESVEVERAAQHSEQASIKYSHVSSTQQTCAPPSWPIYIYIPILLLERLIDDHQSYDHE